MQNIEAISRLISSSYSIECVCALLTDIELIDLLEDGDGDPINEKPLFAEALTRMWLYGDKCPPELPELATANCPNLVNQLPRRMVGEKFIGFPSPGNEMDNEIAEHACRRIKQYLDANGLIAVVEKESEEAIAIPFTLKNDDSEFVNDCQGIKIDEWSLFNKKFLRSSTNKTPHIQILCECGGRKDVLKGGSFALPVLFAEERRIGNLGNYNPLEILLTGVIDGTGALETTKGIEAKRKLAERLGVKAFVYPGEKTVNNAIDIPVPIGTKFHVDALKKIEETLKRKEIILGVSRNSIFTNVPSSPRNFIGREEDLRNLHSAIQNAPQDPFRAVVIHAYCGTGKTAFAYKYAEQYKESYPGGCFYVEAASYDSMDQALIRLFEVHSRAAENLGIRFPEKYNSAESQEGGMTQDEKWDLVQRCVLNRLEQSGHILLLLDNVENVTMFHEDSMAKMASLEGIHIYATMRIGLATYAEKMRMFPLNSLSVEESVEVLKRYCPLTDTEDERNAAKEIAVFLGGNAWALNLIGQQIRSNKKRAGLPKNTYRQKMDDLRVLKLSAWVENLPSNIYGTVKINGKNAVSPVELARPTLEMIRKETPDIFAFAIRAALCHPDHVSFEWLSASYPDKPSTIIKEWLAQLCDFNILLSAQDNGYYQMHRLSKYTLNEYSPAETKIEIRKLFSSLDRPKNALDIEFSNLCLSISFYFNEQQSLSLAKECLLYSRMPFQDEVGKRILQSSFTDKNIINLVDQIYFGQKIDRTVLISLVIYAAQFGRYIVLRWLIDKKGLDPSAKDNQGRTLLHLACEGGHLNIVEWLMFDKGLDPSSVDNYDTPAIALAFPCHFDVVRRLLDEQVLDLSLKSDLGLTLLHDAARYGCLDIVRRLVDEKGLDPSKKDNIGCTLLHIACEGGHLNVVEWLVDVKGLDPSSVDKYGTPATVYACYSCHLDIIQWLVDVKGLVTHLKYYESRRGTPFLHLAIDSEILLRWLIDEKGLDPFVKDREGRNLLHLTVGASCDMLVDDSLERLSIIEWLVDEKGLDLFARDNDGETVLHYAPSNERILRWLVDEKGLDLQYENGCALLYRACCDGNLGVLRWLIDEKGIAPSFVQDNLGRTLLHVACDYGYPNIVDWLVFEKGLDPSAKDDEGRTLLHRVTQYGCLDIVRRLVDEKGLDPSIKDNHGRTPLHTVTEWRKFDVDLFLWDKLDIVRWLIDKKGLDPCVKDDHGKTLLHNAASFGQLEILRWLIDEKGLDPSVKDNHGRTLLHLACEGGHLNIVKWLVEDKGLDPSAKDNNGRTSLHYAATCYGYLDLLKWLIEEKRVCLSMRDNTGQTALDIISKTELFYVNRARLKSVDYLTSCMAHEGQLK